MICSYFGVVVKLKFVKISDVRIPSKGLSATCIVVVVFTTHDTVKVCVVLWCVGC